MDYSDAEPDVLMTAYYKGDDRALDTLVDRFFAPLAAYFRGSVSRDDAEDLALETFVRVARTRMPEWSSGMFGSERCAFQPWLFRVARNLMYDHLRRLGREPHPIRDPDPPDEEESPIEQLPSDKPSPQDLMEAAEFAEAVNGCIAQLHPLYREAATFHLEELSLPEVAEICNIPYGTAGSRRSNALRQLRSCLQAKGFRPD